MTRGGIEVVVLERDVPGSACIVADEHNGGCLATRHLLELGHRKIGCIVLAGGSTSSVARAQGDRTALHEAGILPQEGWSLQRRKRLNARRNASAQRSQVTRR